MRKLSGIAATGVVLVAATALVGAAGAAGAVSAAGATPSSPTAGPAALHRSILLLPAGEWTSVGAAELAVRASGGRVVAGYPVARSLLVDVPASFTAPGGSTLVADRALNVAGGAGSGDADSGSTTSTMRATIGEPPSGGGAGVTVAVIDTGVASVADLQGRVTHTSVLPGANGDGYGHGTFMAGLIGGSGAGSAGRFDGIAPAARIFDVRVSSPSGDTSLSNVLAGLQAVSDRQQVDPSLLVLNLSLSEDSPVPPALDPLAQGLEALWDNGITVVVAAGNDGPSNGSVTAPGNDPVVLTVGALDEGGSSNRSGDSVPAFSSRGVPFGPGAKPDLVAPGVSLVSLRAPGSVVDVANPSARVGSAYFKGTGTSMAAAVTSGAAAVLLSARPALSPDQVKAILTSTAYDVQARGNAEGAGGLDLAAALKARAPHVNPTPPGDGPDSGPMAASSDDWAAFAAAWASGNIRATQAAWARLPFGVQQWATKAWAIDVALVGPNDNATAAARAWSARSWSARSWSANDWLAAAWSARAWSDDDWAARAWSARAWSARSWSDDDWATFTLTARSWSARSWSARSWSVIGWGS